MVFKSVSNNMAFHAGLKYDFIRPSSVILDNQLFIGIKPKKKDSQKHAIERNKYPEMTDRIATALKARTGKSYILGEYTYILNTPGSKLDWVFLPTEKLWNTLSQSFRKVRFIGFPFDRTPGEYDPEKQKKTDGNLKKSREKVEQELIKTMPSLVQERKRMEEELKLVNWKLSFYNLSGAPIMDKFTTEREKRKHSNKYISNIPDEDDYDMLKEVEKRVKKKIKEIGIRYQSTFLRIARKMKREGLI